MGISGLIPVLQPIHSQVSLEKYSGQVVGVDGYVWLHKGAFGCAVDLCTGKKTTKYVEYCMRKTKMLLDFGITPLIVFDGGSQSRNLTV